MRRKAWKSRATIQAGGREKRRIECAIVGGVVVPDVGKGIQKQTSEVRLMMDDWTMELKRETNDWDSDGGRSQLVQTDGGGEEGKGRVLRQGNHIFRDIVFLSGREPEQRVGQGGADMDELRADPRCATSIHASIHGTAQQDASNGASRLAAEAAASRPHRV